MNKNCPIYEIVDFIGKKWTLLILVELYKGESGWKRYSQIKNKIPEMTPKILSTRLKELEKKGLITKRIDTERFPIKSEYSLTKMGEDFVRIIRYMKDWGLKWKTRNDACENVDCKECDM